MTLSEIKRNLDEKLESKYGNRFFTIEDTLRISIPILSGVSDCDDFNENLGVSTFNLSQVEIGNTLYIARKFDKNGLMPKYLLGLFPTFDIISEISYVDEKMLNDAISFAQYVGFPIPEKQLPNIGYNHQLLENETDLFNTVNDVLGKLHIRYKRINPYYEEFIA